jgi:4-hydroxy-tetrahydrodipicolinate reductase
MKIALLGYGKMGKEIEKIALQRGHEIILKVDAFTPYFDIKLADIAIEFSVPEKAAENIRLCIENQIPIISGTTGWLDQYKEIKELCIQKKGAFIYASNFSLGVNLFFELNLQLVKMMDKFKQYDVSIEEIHHTQKLDAPSGTAISLAEQIIQNTDKTKWSLNSTKQNELLITAKREDTVPGTHSVFYKSSIDEIEIKHTAHNREGFALGAVIAAEWLYGREGIYSMKDVLGI